MKSDLIKGVLLGIISPIIAFIIYVVFIIETTLGNVINNPSFNRNLPAIISLSLLINLALFFLKIKFNKDEQSSGILFSTFLYGVVIVILKFL
ncbi:hypothetical protein OAJ56_02260 [Flavobacteriales bacterium]|nr:hypothetical protein [Flavobacteriales bacterium]